MRQTVVFTGSRADYGLLEPLLHGMVDHPSLDVGVLVGGTHLSERHGNTITEVEEGPAPIVGRVFGAVDSTSPRGVATAVGLGVIGAAAELERLKPDLLVVLGDRFETFAVAQAAMISRIPIAHLHGGEATEGVIDEPIRHSITKMAQLHFVAAEPFRRRVIQLGEDPARVWTTGSPGIDAIQRIPPMPRSACCDALGIPNDHPFLLVTYHPVSLHADEAAEVAALLGALDDLVDVSIVITGTNTDTGASAVAHQLIEFARRGPDRVLVQSLGRRRYVQTMRHCAAVVGNSSSGLIEAPAVGVPTVDIGDRQRGRYQAPSVLHVAAHRDEILDAVAQALAPEHRSLAASSTSPYGDGASVPRIVSLLAEAPLDVLKRFHEVG